MAMLATARETTKARRQAFNPLRLTGTGVLVFSGVVCVLDASGVTRKAVVGALMLCAVLSIVLARRSLPPRQGTLAVTLAIVTGLAATILAPKGLAEVPVLAGAVNLPRYVPAGPPRYTAIGAVSVAFGVSIMVISGSPIGLLAGVGAWALADRSIEHAAFQAERDRALALLAEVEASRQAQREAAAAEERNRIAREMHDVLAHSLAGLSMQLQAVRAVAGREGVSASITGPIDRAAELAREGAKEARAAVGALRAPRLRGMDDLHGLVDGFPGEASLNVTGHPGHLRPEAGHAVYRAVQEAMTNAARYATGSGINVDVAWGTARLRVRIRDHGLPAQHKPSGVKGSGTGIKSMAERIEAVGGTLTVGPDPHGPGWLVEVQVPVTGGADGEVNA
jgi:signal transduction histidine kinase